MKVVLVLSALVAVAFGKATTVFQPSYYPSDPRNVSYDLKVVNGQNAARNQFPYQVSLQRRGTFTWQHICGGSIISTNWILTAAHCTPLAASSYRIVAGITQLNDNGVAGQQTLSVSTVINHPLYPGNNQVAPNDVSLLRLATSLTYGVNVQPIAIPRQGRIYQGDATLSGWGLTFTGGSVPNHLQFVELPIVPEAECNSILNSYLGTHRNPFSIDLNVCSGIRRGGESACNGDSGGPLEHNGLVFGVVSWVLIPCGEAGAPSVYAKTSAFSDWIVQQTGGEVRPAD